ncbi:MAG: SLC13 family permease [Pseudomonadota bacterium]
MDIMLGLVLGLFAVVFALLIWGRFRYDLVAFGALCVALAFGIVPKEEAFSGFAHEATVFVALVLVISQGLVRSGAVDSLTDLIVRPGRSVSGHVGVMGGMAVLLSGFMNNVAALAILMPIDIQAARTAKRAAGKTLMPLSFATLLGGLVTLIGTPPNLIISSARANHFGEPFEMFDFAPVGLAVALSGLAFIALIGWRFLPGRIGSDDADSRVEGEEVDAYHDVSDYVTEMIVGKAASIIGMTGAELKKQLGEDGGLYLSMSRKGADTIDDQMHTPFREHDVVVVEGSPQQLNKMRRDFGLQFTGEGRHNALYGGALSVSEVVVTRESRLVGRAAVTVRLLRRQGVSVAGVSRQGRPFAKSVGHILLQAGDVLLLVGSQSRLADAIEWLDCLPLARRDIHMNHTSQAFLAIGIFGTAIALSSTGIIPLAAALAGVVVLYALTEIVPLREIYRSVAWPVIVLLGSIIPLAGALERSGGTDLFAQSLISLTAGLPDVAALVLLMVLVMMMADMMNTVATAVISAPIAIDVADRLGTNADPFLMAVAVASSCAMLTPIGHKNNTIILGPGGYRFSDYWRLGLPLQGLILIVAVPAIVIVWPL